MGHGDADPVVQYKWGQATASKYPHLSLQMEISLTESATLKQWGWDVDFKTYKHLAHSADPEEIDDLKAYLQKAIPEKGEEKL